MAMLMYELREVGMINKYIAMSLLAVLVNRFPFQRPLYYGIYRCNLMMHIGGTKEHLVVSRFALGFFCERGIIDLYRKYVNIHI